MNKPRTIAKSTGVPDLYRDPWQRPADVVWNTRFNQAIARLQAGGMVAMVGKRGGGKTRLAAEIVREGAPTTARYTTAMGLFLKIRDSYNGDGPKELAIITELAEASLLIIDEIQERGNTDWEDRLLTHLIDLRYGSKMPTIIIGNLEPGALIEALGSSIASRFNEVGAIMEITGPSHRKQA
jgi:DNA replication protein DnaC